MKSYKKYMQEMGQNGSKTLEQVFFRSVSDARTPTNDKNSISNFLFHRTSPVARKAQLMKRP